jgi:hypothetical protein
MENLTRKDEIIYGPDGIQNEKLPTHPFVGCAYPKALGYFIYPGLKHYYADNWFFHLSHYAGKLKYVPELKVEHRHPCLNIFKQDLTYTEANKLYFEADYKLYTEEVYGGAKGGGKAAQAMGHKVKQWMATQAIAELHH